MKDLINISYPVLTPPEDKMNANATPGWQDDRTLIERNQLVWGEST